MHLINSSATSHCDVQYKSMDYSSLCDEACELQDNIPIINYVLFTSIIYLTNITAIMSIQNSEF